MSDRLAPMRANMRAFYRLLGERSPGGEVVECQGMVAAIVPSCPGRSIVNAVVYERPEELAAEREELARRYRRAGVRAWTVWVPEADRASAELLARTGHRLDGSPRAMTLELAGMQLAGAGEVEWARTRDAHALAAINEAAYGLPAGEFTAAMSAFSDDPTLLYLARVDGRPAACLAALDDDGDCGIYLVATIPSARGRGLASALLQQALAEACERGCATSSLQATAAGFPVYQRCGYRDLCAIEMWEHRQA
ncbi:MAG: GNAT family N-acetyltransferase [Actinobacteria bacterium]|nr:MAG: GNAT family N-acetyltransferase [Actinomycetota bacterium]